MPPDRDRASEVPRISIPPAVLAGLEVVRQSGRTNMLDRPVVAELERFGFEETAEWVREHPAEYARGIFRGFAADEGTA